MKRFVTLIALVILFCSCSENEDSHPISEMRVNFYNDKGENIPSDEIKSRLNDLRVKIVPVNSNTLDFPYFNKETNQVSSIFVPLFYNTDKKYDSGTVPKGVEEFKFILTYEKKEIFSREFQLYYNHSDPPATVTKINVKNSNGKWEAYKPQKIEVKKNGESTGIFVEVK